MSERPKNTNSVKFSAVETVVNGSSEAQNELVPLVKTSLETKGAAGVILKCLTFVVLILGVVQYMYGVVDHSSLLKMQFAASALVFISSIEHIWQKSQTIPSSDTQTVFLLFRTAGIVFYIACLFLNLTHCLEEISDIKTADTADADTNHSHGHSQQNATIYLSLADFVIKLIVTIMFNVLSINLLATLVAIVFPSVFTCLVFAYNFFESHFFFDWLDHHLEPVVSIGLTILCITIAIFSLIRKKQFLLAEGPNDFSIDKISTSVKSKNENLEKIDHVHASCEWPEGFTVSLKAYIKVEKTNKDWVSRAANDFAELKALLHEEIKAEGAKEVIVEPVFVDRNENPDLQDPVCISASCHNEDVGCCTNPKTLAEDSV